MASNKLLLEIDNQIFNLYNLIRDKYWNKFQELESVVQDPIDYARAVKKIGNEKDMSLIDFQGNGLNLSPAILIVVSITASTIRACDCLIALDSSRKRILGFLETRVVYIAPNLSAIVGSAVAAKLIGLSSLVNTPALKTQTQT